MENKLPIAQLIGVLVVCHAVLGRSIVVDFDQNMSSDESNSSDEGEYDVGSRDVASIVEKLRSRLLIVADRAKKTLAGRSTSEIEAKQMIDVPVNCPEGWRPGYDGECHPDFDAARLEDVKRKGDNIIDPPINCPEGWLPGEDGECHPIFDTKGEVPNPAEESGEGSKSGCPEGKSPNENGKC